jgi:hypothetical protein
MSTPPTDPNASFAHNADGTVTVCVTGIFPKMNTISTMLGFGQSLTFAPISWPSLSGGYDALLLVGKALLKTVMAICKPILTVLGMGFSALLAIGDAAWQALCGIGLSLADIFDLDISAMLTKIKNWWESATGSPMFPKPLFGPIGSALLEVGHILVTAICSAATFVINLLGEKITDLVNKVKQIMSAITGGTYSFSLPTVPKMPTFTEIMAAIKAAACNTAQDAWTALKAFFAPILGVLGALVMAIPDLPNPLFGLTSAFNIEIVKLATDFTNQIAMIAAQWIIDNIIIPIMALASYLGLSGLWPPTGIFPICVTLPANSV